MPRWYPSIFIKPDSKYAHMSYSDRVARVIGRIYKGMYVPEWESKKKIYSLAERLSANPGSTTQRVIECLGTRLGIFDGDGVVDTLRRKISISNIAEEKHACVLMAAENLIGTLMPLCSNEEIYSWPPRWVDWASYGLRLDPRHMSQAGKSFLREFIFRFCKNFPGEDPADSPFEAIRRLNRFIPMFRKWSISMQKLEGGDKHYVSNLLP